MKIYNREEFLKLPAGVIFYRLIRDDIDEEYDRTSDCSIKMENRTGKYEDITYLPIFTSPEICLENGSLFDAIDLLNKGCKWLDEKIVKLNFKIKNSEHWWRRENNEDSDILYLVLEKSDWEQIKGLVEKAYG